MGLSNCVTVSLTRAVLICALLLPAGFSVQAQTSAEGRQAGADNEYQTGAILWTQSSAEYHALTYQAFSLAKLRLDQALANRKSLRSVKPPAVIVDVDETVLDNRRFQTRRVTIQRRWRRCLKSWKLRTRRNQVPLLRSSQTIPLQLIGERHHWRWPPVFLSMRNTSSTHFRIQSRQGAAVATVQRESVQRWRDKRIGGWRSRSSNPKEKAAHTG
jgi:HAD superfamily, subfamily IIIB (Acid phosphatase)